MSSRTRRARPVARRLAVLVVLAMVVLAGCKVRAEVGIEVADDGSGTVSVRLRLDPAAVRALERGGSSLDDAVRLDGLERAGWELSGWQRSSKGASIVARKDFDRLADLAAVLAEVDGTAGVIRKVTVRRDATRLRTDQSIAMVVDLRSVRAGIAADREVADALRTAGVDPDALDAELSGELRDALSLRLSIAMPGGTTKTWTVRAGQTRRASLSESQRHNGPIVWAALAVGSALVALALLLVASRSAARSRARAGSRRAPSAPAADPAVPSAPAADETAPIGGPQDPEPGVPR